MNGIVPIKAIDNQLKAAVTIAWFNSVSPAFLQENLIDDPNPRNIPAVIDIHLIAHNSPKIMGTMIADRETIPTTISIDPKSLKMIFAPSIYSPWKIIQKR
jgi:hypothetical protein